MCLWMAFFLRNVAGLCILKVLAIVLPSLFFFPLFDNSYNIKTNFAGIPAVNMCDCFR
jgi:hypothetical protein